jgi:hypothetical protein
LIIIIITPFSPSFFWDLQYENTKIHTRDNVTPFGNIFIRSHRWVVGICVLLKVITTAIQTRGTETTFQS